MVPSLWKLFAQIWQVDFKQLLDLVAKLCKSLPVLLQIHFP